MIEFIEGAPPAHKRDQWFWTEVTDALKSRPGEWAIIKDGSQGDIMDLYSVRAYIHSGRSPKMPKGDFEATVREDKVFARYVGGREGRVGITNQEGVQR